MNEDGTKGQDLFVANYDSYTTKDNLPVDVKYTTFIAGYSTDEEGNPLDYHDRGTIHYDYISGCNQVPSD